MADSHLWKAAIVVPARLVAAAEEALGGLHPETRALSSFEATGENRWCVEALLTARPNKRPLIRALDAIGANTARLSITPLPDIDWVAESRKSMKPVDVGRFHIYPRHHSAAVPGAMIGIMIDPGLAFGTGTHASTRGCLLALDGLARGRRVRRPLDLGCGSGILAIAMAKLWRAPVLASDIDPVASFVARANAGLNGVGGLVRTITANGLRHPAITARAPFDLIVANILARPLERLAHGLAQRLEGGGTIILSGLVAAQESAVRSAYLRHGLRLRRRIALDDWRTLVMGRN